MILKVYGYGIDPAKIVGKHEKRYPPHSAANTERKEAKIEPMRLMELGETEGKTKVMGSARTRGQWMTGRKVIQNVTKPVNRQEVGPLTHES